MNSQTKTMWQFIVAGAAGLVTAGLLLWALLASIEPATYNAMQDDLARISKWILWVAAIGQTAFVLTWATLPWWTHWVGRALMVKSLSLMLYLDIAVVLINVDYFYGLNLLALILLGIVTVGIWTQLVTIVVETRNRGRSRIDAEPALKD